MHANTGLCADTASNGVLAGVAPGDTWRSLGSLARRAREGALASLPQRSQDAELRAPLASSSSEGPPLNTSSSSSADADPERGDNTLQWSSWARRAAEQATETTKRAAERAAEQAQQGLAKAKSVDWGERVKTMQSDAANSFERVQESTSSATSSVLERVSHGVDRAKSFDTARISEQAGDLRRGMSTRIDSVSDTVSSAGLAMQERGQAGMQTIKDAQVLQGVADGAASAADRTRGALSIAGEQASGAAALAMSPRRIAKFFALFAMGCFFIILSLNFLPMLLIAPSSFSLLFTIGSVTVLGSFVFLSGPKAFAEKQLQRHKLPFAVAYLLGLLGTLWATIIRRSYIFTALFAVVQALALLYYVCSGVPGGRAGLNMLFSFGGRSARSLLLQS